MKGLKIFFLVMTGCLIVSIVYADIYEWTDENGVRHFTNFPPPAVTGDIITTPEVPYDAAADQARMEAERQELLELALREIAEREAELERREAEAARNLAETNRRAEEKLQKAEELLDDVITERNTRRISWTSSYYPVYYPHSDDGQRHHRSKHHRQRHNRGETHHPEQHAQSHDQNRHVTPQIQLLDISHYNRNIFSGLHVNFRLR